MNLVGLVLFVWSAVYASVVAWALLRSRRMQPPAAEALEAGRLMLVRPCAGHEPELEQTLRSSVVDGDRRLTVRFAVAREDDTATPVARLVAASLVEAGFDVDVLVTGASAANRKADQLAYASSIALDRPWLVTADSDVLLQPGDLAAVTGPLARPGVGLVWSVPVPDGVATTNGDRLEAAVLGATLHAFVLLAAIDRQGVVGKLLGICRQALDAAGGYGALVSTLGEDVELARRMRASGHHVVVSGVARARPRALGVRAAVARLSRWLLVVRGQRPALLASYPLLFFPALPAATAACLVGTGWGYAAAAGFALARVALAHFALPASLKRVSTARSLAWGLAADLAMAAAFARTLLTARTTWRGTTLRVTAGGQLRLEDAP